MRANEGQWGSIRVDEDAPRVDEVDKRRERLDHEAGPEDEQQLEPRPSSAKTPETFLVASRHLLSQQFQVMNYQHSEMQ